MGFIIGGIEKAVSYDQALRCQVQGCMFPEMPNGQHLCYLHSRAAQKLLANLSVQAAKKAAKQGLQFVYFVQHGDDGPIKIGVTKKDPERRLAGLQNNTPVNLRMLAFLPAEWWLEKALHRALAALHIRGEWFHYGPELQLIVALCLDGQGAKVHDFAEREGGIKYKQRRSTLVRRNADRNEYFLRPEAVVDY